MLGGGFGVGVAAGRGNWEENEKNDSNPRNSFIYSGVRAHMSADLRVCGFGYQNFKPISRYPLGLELYPRPRPRVQTQTRIRAHRVRYPRICGFSVPVAILIPGVCS